MQKCHLLGSNRALSAVCVTVARCGAGLVPEAADDELYARTFSLVGERSVLLGHPALESQLSSL